MANRVKSQVAPKTTSPLLLEIFKIMADKDMGTKTMAELLETSVHTVSRWRSGRSDPCLLSAEKMAIELGYRLKLEKVG